MVEIAKQKLNSSVLALLLSKDLILNKKMSGKLQYLHHYYSFIWEPRIQPHIQQVKEHSPQAKIW